MTNFIITILYGLTIGIALSVDAFMLSLIYGSTFKRKLESVITSFLVGLFHFIMPIFGYVFAFYFFRKINMSVYLDGKIKFIAFIILFILGLMMLLKKKSNEPFNINNLINKSLFAFSVSIDSFLTGVAFTTIDHINIIIASFLFAIVSCSLTFVALTIGKKGGRKLLNANLDYYAGLIMIILAIISLFI